jgi:hypothetical protein
MQDLKARFEKLLADADDCELIGNLAADVRKRAAFARLASQYRAMAEAIREEIETAELAKEKADASRSAHDGSINPDQNPQPH